MGIRLKQGQLPIQIEQHGGHPDQGDQVDNHIRDGMGDELFEQVGIVDHVRHQVADLLVLIETQGKALHMFVDVFAHIRHHAPAGHVRQVRAHEGQPGPHDVGPQHDQSQRGDVVIIRQGGARVGDRAISRVMIHGINSWMPTRASMLRAVTTRDFVYRRA